MTKPCEHLVHDPQCRVCWLSVNDRRYQQLWNIESSVELSTTCIHLGATTGDMVSCPTCKGTVQLKLFGCNRYGTCTTVTPVEGVACCNGSRDKDGVIRPCPGYETVRKPPLEPVMVIGDAKEAQPIKPLTWSYGVTTVPSRLTTMLPKTLTSLAAAGFDQPRLFVDGAGYGWQHFGLPTTYRDPAVHAYGNWILALWELYLRQPTAERYAIFQDDLLAVANLRRYLDVCPHPDHGYLNLYQYGDMNQHLAPPVHKIGLTGRRKGSWYEAVELPSGRVYHGKRQQRGLGALALVFDRNGVVELLKHRHTVERPQDVRDDRKGGQMSWSKIDGAIVESMNQAGWREWVHDPSLVQHIGETSTLGNKRHPTAPSFPGQQFDAMSLVD